jgi:hypothetical protein
MESVSYVDESSIDVGHFPTFGTRCGVLVHDADGPVKII